MQTQTAECFVPSETEESRSVCETTNELSQHTECMSFQLEYNPTSQIHIHSRGHGVKVGLWPSVHLFIHVQQEINVNKKMNYLLEYKLHLLVIVPCLFTDHASGAMPDR